MMVCGDGNRGVEWMRMVTFMTMKIGHAHAARDAMHMKAGLVQRRVAEEERRCERFKE